MINLYNQQPTFALFAAKIDLRDLTNGFPAESMATIVSVCGKKHEKRNSGTCEFDQTRTYTHLNKRGKTKPAR